MRALIGHGGANESAYFDLFYEASHLALRVPNVPRALLPPDAPRPAALVGASIEALLRSWGERFGRRCVERALQLPTGDLIEFDAAHWQRLGLPVPRPVR